MIGNDAIDVFSALTWDEVGDDRKFQKVLLKFAEHCEPRNISATRDTNSSQEPKKAAKASTSMYPESFVNLEH